MFLKVTCQYLIPWVTALVEGLLGDEGGEVPGWCLRMESCPIREYKGAFFSLTPHEVANFELGSDIH